MRITSISMGMRGEPEVLVELCGTVGSKDVEELHRLIGQEVAVIRKRRGRMAWLRRNRTDVRGLS